MSHTPSFLIGVGFDSAVIDTPKHTIVELLQAIRNLDAAGVDFVTLDDTFSGVDAAITASFISSQTRQIGLVPTVSTTHTEPFHISTAIATLDYSARARAGWQAAPSTSSELAQAFGRREATSALAAWTETEQVVDVVRALWDSWEDDAEIRDARTGRFLDRAKVHYIDAELTDSEGKPYSVKGPSIVPRPPQGHPPVIITVVDDTSRQIALTKADVIIIPVQDVASAVTEVAALTAELSDTGRTARVLPSVELPAEVAQIQSLLHALIDASLPGIHLRAQHPVNDSQNLAQEIVDSNGAYGYHRQARSLRDRLGLAQARNQFVS